MATDLDMVLHHSLGLEITKALVAPQGTQTIMAPEVAMAFRHKHELRWLTRLQASTGPSEVIEAMDVNTDPGCCRAMDLYHFFEKLLEYL